LRRSRGKKVLENSIFGPRDAITVTDRYGAYNYFDESMRQLCWSHLARDFERFAHSHHKEVRVLGEYLKKIVMPPKKWTSVRETILWYKHRIKVRFIK